MLRCGMFRSLGGAPVLLNAGHDVHLASGQSRTPRGTCCCTLTLRTHGKRHPADITSVCCPPAD